MLLGKSAVSVKVAVVLPNGKRSEANGTATLSDDDGNVTQKSVMYAVREAQSVGLKLALTNFGMGLHLYFNHDDEEAPRKPARAAKPQSQKPQQQYEEEEQEEKPARGSRGSKSNGNDWASKRNTFKFPIGKPDVKGKPYSELEDGLLNWADETLDEEKQAKILSCVRQEIQYRKDNGEWNPSAGKGKGGQKGPKRKIGQPAPKPQDDEDDWL